MKLKLKGQVTAADLAELRDIHARIMRLTVGLHPASTASIALVSLIWCAKACIRSWETDGEFLNGRP